MHNKPHSKKTKDKLSEIHKGKHYSLRTEFKKGHKMSQTTKDKISKTLEGRIHTKEARIKLSKAHQGMKKPWARPPHLTGEKSSHWKGDNVGYTGIHDWIRKEKGKPMECEHCGRTNKETRLQYANINGHIYSRNPDEYIPLCGSCHRKYDIKNKNK